MSKLVQLKCRITGFGLQSFKQSSRNIQILTRICQFAFASQQKIKMAIYLNFHHLFEFFFLAESTLFSQQQHNVGKTYLLKDRVTFATENSYPPLQLFEFEEGLQS